METVGISNGDLVTDLVLYMQAGFDTQPAQLGVYSVDESLIVLPKTDHSLGGGVHYFFHFSYRNGEGDSPFSDVTEVALADFPAQPAAVSKVDELSSLTSIAIEW